VALDNSGIRAKRWKKGALFSYADPEGRSINVSHTGGTRRIKRNRRRWFQGEGAGELCPEFPFRQAGAARSQEINRMVIKSSAGVPDFSGKQPVVDQALTLKCIGKSTCPKACTPTHPEKSFSRLIKLRKMHLFRHTGLHRHLRSKRAWSRRPVPSLRGTSKISQGSGPGALLNGVKKDSLNRDCGGNLALRRGSKIDRKGGKNWVK